MRSLKDLSTTVDQLKDEIQKLTKTHEDKVDATLAQKVDELMAV